MEHSYLLLSGMVAVAGMLGALVVPNYRWLVVASGMFAAPSGLADYIFVPEYWQPDHIIGPWLSLEGLLFSFGNGCLVIAVVARRWPDLHAQFPTDYIGPLKRLTVFMVLGFCVFLLAWQSGLGRLMIMHATFFGFAAIVLLLLSQRSFSMRVALTAGSGFAVIYWAETLIWNWINPGFVGFWIAKDAYWYSLPFPPGLPIEEYLWAFSYGAIWAHLILHSFRANLRAPEMVKPT